MSGARTSRQELTLRGRPVGVAEIPAPDALVSTTRVDQNDWWYFCGAPSVNQGWKIYVPLTMVNASEIVSLLAPIVEAASYPFKYVKNIRLLRKLNAGYFGYSQIGKCFVIYLPARNDRFTVRLKEALDPYRGQSPAVPFARAVGGDLPLYYRYGAYRGTQLSLEGRPTADDRANAPAAVPDDVDDIFAPHHEPVETDPDVDAFVGRYPAFEAIQQQGKCGIFRSLRLDSEVYEEVILKVGYHRGQVQPDGSDGCAFVRRELAFYRELAERGLDAVAPRLIDSLDRPRKTILVLESIPGTSLLIRKLEGRLEVDHLERSWSMIRRIHRTGLVLGDAKIANFMATDDGDLRVMDFEAAGPRCAQRSDMQTFFLADPTPEDPAVADLAHFLVSVLYPYESGRYSWEDRHVELRALLAEPRDEPTVAWAQSRLQALLA